MTGSSSDSSIFCVILLVFILLLVLIFLSYRRRALCFGKMKNKQKMTDNDIHVEPQDVENWEEQEYEVCYNFIQDSILSRASRAVARTLIDGGGVYIHIFMLCRVISFDINSNNN